MLPLRSRWVQQHLPQSILKGPLTWSNTRLDGVGTPRTLRASSSNGPQSQTLIQQSHTMPPPKPGNKRPTHFVCFPLVTEESVAQLVESLAYFRSITTPVGSESHDLRPGKQSELSDQRPSSTTGTPSLSSGASAGPEDPGSEPAGAHADDSLRLIPEAAHRPPGTFHLTLGTMDLSDPEDMDRAVKLLEEIDYAALLRRAEISEIEQGKDGKRAARRRGLKAEDEDEDEARHAVVADDVEPKERDEKGIPGEQHDEEDTNSAGQTTRQSLHSPLRSLERRVSPPPLSNAGSTAPRAPTVPDNSFPQTSPSSTLTTLKTTLSGLGVFPQPSSARVFYAHPSDPTRKLQRFGSLIRTLFQDEGLITETRPLVLHATVANMIYVKGRGKGGRGRGGWRGGRGGGKRDANTVDARAILRFFNADAYNGEMAEGALRPPPPPPSLSATSSTTTPSPLDNRDQSLAHDHTTATAGGSNPITFARDIAITRIRICKMGAEKCATPGWGMEYRAIAERVF